MELTLLLSLAKFKYLLFFLLFLGFLGLAFLGSVQSVLNRPANLQELEIINGDTLFNRINKLNLNSFEEVVLKAFYSLSSLNQIYSGVYDLNNMSVGEYLSAILSGDLKYFKLQIIEGENIFDITTKIENIFKNNDCPELICLRNDLFPFVEGTLFPETYFLTSTDSLKTVLLNSQQRLNNLLSDYWKSSESELNNKYDALILASIIEKEAGNKSEMPIIASVFFNRIKKGMKLQTDPTIIYGLLPNFDGDIKKKDILDKNNPFNTYVINGLPPTPISIISESSLDAVFNHADSEFYYFVAKGNGEHYFSKTLEEHEAAVRKFQLQ